MNEFESIMKEIGVVSNDPAYLKLSMGQAECVKEEARNTDDPKTSTKEKIVSAGSTGINATQTEVTLAIKI